MNTPLPTPAHPEERIKKVRSIFENITDRYDFLNHFLSAGLDRGWRKRMIGAMRFFRTRRYLDLASGTGDVAFACARKHPDVQVHGIDFSGAMIRAAETKAAREGLESRVRFSQADATRLPFADNAFDAAGIAFGIRNIPDKAAALREMARVIVPGGRVVILELTTPESPVVRKGYTFHLTKLMPFMAGLFTDNKAAYRYLAESIRDFPSKAGFLSLMEKAGLKECGARPLSLGICHLYTGYKLEAPKP